jgi:hypothetical protein
MTIASGGQALTLGQEPLELAVVPRSKGLEDRGRALAISLLLQADRIRFGLLALARDANTVDPCTIEAENLGPKLWGELRIAVRGEERGRDLEGTKGLNLILGRAIPDRIRAPQNVVLPDVNQQLAQEVGGKDAWRAYLSAHAQARLPGQVSW